MKNLRRQDAVIGVAVYQLLTGCVSPCEMESTPPVAATEAPVAPPPAAPIPDVTKAEPEKTFDWDKASDDLKNWGAIARTQRTLKLTFKTDPLFAPSTSTIAASMQPRMEELADKIQTLPYVAVQIQVFTDTSGKKDKNLQFSKLRAAALRDLFLKRGIDSARLQAEGRGDAEAVAGNTTADGRAQNRRVEIVVTWAATEKAAIEKPAAAAASPEERLKAYGAVTGTGDQLQLEFPTDPVFAPSKAQLTPAAKTRMEGLAQVLSSLPYQAIQLEVFTDTSGKQASNLKISQERAATIRALLLKAQTQDTKLATIGRGDAEPIADNKTPAGRSSNRRVRIKLNLTAAATAATPRAAPTPPPAPPAPVTPKAPAPEELLRAFGEVSGSVPNLQLEFPTDPVFAPSKAQFKPDAKDRMEKLAQLIQSLPYHTIRLEAFTDTSGKQAGNLKISQERAAAMRALLLKATVVEAKLETTGRGDAEPIADNKTADGRSRNRRIRIALHLQPPPEAPKPEVAKDEPKKVEEPNLDGLFRWDGIAIEERLLFRNNHNGANLSTMPSWKPTYRFGQGWMAGAQLGVTSMKDTEENFIATRALLSIAYERFSCYSYPELLIGVESWSVHNGGTFRTIAINEHVRLLPMKSGVEWVDAITSRMDGWYVGYQYTDVEKAAAYSMLLGVGFHLF